MSKCMYCEEDPCSCEKIQQEIRKNYWENWSQWIQKIINFLKFK